MLKVRWQEEPEIYPTTTRCLVSSRNDPVIESSLIVAISPKSNFVLNIFLQFAMGNDVSTPKKGGGSRRGKGACWNHSLCASIPPRWHLCQHREE